VGRQAQESWRFVAVVGSLPHKRRSANLHHRPISPAFQGSSSARPSHTSEMICPSCSTYGWYGPVPLCEATERRTKTDWAHFIEDIANSYPHAQRITPVMDNLNTHTPASL
jgi:hypothetical protein